MRKNHPMMAIDIENYSGRNEAQQYEAQHGLRSLLENVAREAGLDFTTWSTQWSGDGAFVALPAGTSIGELAEPLLHELNVQLGTRNRRPLPEPWTPIRLRMSLHEGPIRTDGATGIPGAHAVEVNRLVDAEPLRVALACCQGADLALIVSERVFNDYLTDGYGTLSPAKFRQVRVAVKKNRYLAYLYVPNCDLFKVAELDPFDAPPPEETAPAEKESPAGKTAPAEPAAPAGKAAPPEKAVPAEPAGDAPPQIIHGSAHTISHSVVNEAHTGDINVGGVTFGGST